FALDAHPSSPSACDRARARSLQRDGGLVVPTEETTMRDTTSPSRPKPELATLAGGCFWCLEAVFEQIEGVLGVESAYAGGRTPNPTYKQVCTGETGHAEVIQVAYEAAKLTYRDVPEIFFAVHA